MHTVATHLPRWNLTSAFPSVESAEFAQSFQDLRAEITDLTALFDTHDIRRRSVPAVDTGVARLYDEATDSLNALLQRNYTIGAFLSCLTTTDAGDETARKAQSQLYAERVRLDPLVTRYIAWVGSLDERELVVNSDTARAHSYHLQKARHLAQHQMSEAEELLAAQMKPVSATAWAQLHGNMTALLAADVKIDGAVQTLPMSSIRALAGHPVRETRRVAYDAELAAWRKVEVPLAAALNGIKGFQQLVRRRRAYTDDVEPTFAYNGIDRETLEAMQECCVEAMPDMRRYLAAKASALGLRKLAWWDLDAPLGEGSSEWSWPEAKEFVTRNFARYSPRLAEFADMTFQNEWIDAEPRVGKEGGAYCSGLLAGESRIMLNFDGSFSSVSTLAHELGHAYHNLNLKHLPPLLRDTPSTLCETASIFCETLTFESALEGATASQRLALVDTVLQRDLGVIVDIHSRFLFESALFERRAARDLTVAELSELMVDAQRETYGDAVDPLHPYMWAVKGHYYGPLFYNYPYTFGLLFGLGLYSRYLDNPDAFRAQYDNMLASTGVADAATLAARFGFDTRSSSFWRSSLDVVRRSIDSFVQLVDAG